MHGTIDELAAQFTSETTTVEELQAAHAAAAAASRDLHQGLQELDPPDEVVLVALGCDPEPTNDDG